MSGDLVAARENSICIKLNPSFSKRKTGQEIPNTMWEILTCYQVGFFSTGRVI